MRAFSFLLLIGAILTIGCESKNTSANDEEPAEQSNSAAADNGTEFEEEDDEDDGDDEKDSDGSDQASCDADDRNIFCSLCNAYFAFHDDNIRDIKCANSNCSGTFQNMVRF